MEPVVVESDNEEWLQSMGQIYDRIIVGHAPRSYAELPNGIVAIVNCQCKELLDTIKICVSFSFLHSHFFILISFSFHSSFILISFFFPFILISKEVGSL